MVKPLVKQISRARFKALTFAVNSNLHEIAWFSDKDENYLAVIIYDWIDKDWNYVILARDEGYVFRAIEVKNSFKKLESAREALFIKLNHHILSPIKMHQQGDKLPKRNDIFDRRVSSEKLNKKFVYLRDNERHSPAKEIIREIAFSFTEIDGKFFKSFQQDGFDQRLWELYLYAYLHEELFTFDRRYPSPDFVCIKEKNKICIEATTINPPEDTFSEINSPYGVCIPNSEYVSIKFKKTLCKKLNKRYWDLSHVKGHPLIFAIQSFESLGDSTSIISYLFGISHSWEKDEKGNLKIIPEKIDYHQHKESYAQSGFFFLPEAKNISAILFSNSGTISKFNRMGKLASFGSQSVQLIRMGACMSQNPNATEPLLFCINIEDEKYDESWAQGLSMIHNPNASIPINPDLFPNAVHHFYKNGQVITYANDSFVPLTSITLNILAK